MPAPTVTSPPGPVVLNAGTFTIGGTAEANALVRVYKGGTLVGSQQLSGGATAYSLSVPLAQDAANNFTVTATVKETGAPATGANLVAEVYLNDTHAAPNSGQKTTEQSGGTYVVGPIQFDQPGQWTVRWHLHEDCSDEPDDSPHGHAAFYIGVP